MEAVVIGETTFYEQRVTPGHDERRYEVEVSVFDCPPTSRQIGKYYLKAVEDEARWRAEYEAVGHVERITHVRTEGPLQDGTYVVTFNVDTYTEV